MFVGAYLYPAGADEIREDLTYVTPDVARMALEKHFGSVVSDNADEFTSELDDSEIFSEAVDAYNEMLSQNDGFVSLDGVQNVCDVAFYNLQPKSAEISTDVFDQKCEDFVMDLATMEAPASLSSTCPYTISKVNNSQMHIKYARADGTGFIRNGGNIPWRFFNPGAMRDSSLKCALVSTKPNGTFAVFANEATGRKALHQLLSTGSKYNGKTIAQAIEAYAPNHENDTAKYISNLKNMGVNVSKVLPNLTTDEWTKLENAITTLEGWGPNGPSHGGTGTTEHF